MAAIMRLSDDTLARLDLMAGAAGVDMDTLLGRLMDRDPHSHEHRCPTCVRQAALADAEAKALLESHDPLWDLTHA